jgi:hypothetical protein
MMRVAGRVGMEEEGREEGKKKLGVILKLGDFSVSLSTSPRPVLDALALALRGLCGTDAAVVGCWLLAAGRVFQASSP